VEQRSDAFFDALRGRGHEPMLRNRTATIGFDIVRPRGVASWRVSVTGGDIRVEDGSGPVDCRIRADEALFDRIVTGEANAMAAMLRGALLTEGNADLLVAARRLMTAPAASSPAEPAGSRTGGQ